MYQILAMTKYSKAFRKFTDDPDSKLNVKLYVQPLNFIEAFLNVDVNLVILDVDLLKEKTIQLTRIIQKIDRNAPIIVIASKESLPVCSAVFSMGISKYLVKPVTSQSFQTLIDAIKNKEVQSKSTHTN